MGFLAIGLRLLPMITEAISWVERFISRKGKYKQDAAVYMVKSILGVAETGLARDLLNDDEVEAATRKCIDAIVSLQNLIAAKSEE